MVTALRLPDGATTYPEGTPAACALCGKVPEFIIEIVEPIVASDEEERTRAESAAGDNP